MLHRLSAKFGKRVFSCQFSSGKHEFPSALNLVQQDSNNFKIQFDNKWSVGDALNGGYLMAVALKTAKLCAPPTMDVICCNGYYMNKGLENTEADLSVTKLSESKSSQMFSVTISQLGLLRTQYIGVLGELPGDNNKPHLLSHQALSPPKLPPLSKCVDGIEMLRSFAGSGLTLANRMSLRLSADSPYVRGFLQNKQSDIASMEGWVAFADGYEPDLLSLSLFSDSYPPCVLNLTQFGWVPTIEYGVYFWSRPVHNKNVGFYEGKNWIRARFSAPYVKNGLLFTDGELWSANGETLLATSRQQARVFTPRTAK